ncbi:hypothetical protein ABH853_11665 [Pseudomonas sp. 13.2]|uniref:Uncharacterized protein n=1 Tax=Pseudomonas sp. 13.2 TaxID=3144665 RepID=A0AAU7BLC6_9PSED
MNLSLGWVGLVDTQEHAYRQDHHQQQEKTIHEQRRRSDFTPRHAGKISLTGTDDAFRRTHAPDPLVDRGNTWQRGKVTQHTWQPQLDVANVGVHLGNLVVSEVPGTPPPEVKHRHDPEQNGGVIPGKALLPTSLLLHSTPPLAATKTLPVMSVLPTTWPVP